MTQSQDIEMLAAFVLDHCDFSEEYEDDAFVVEHEGTRAYVERKRSHFAIHVGRHIHRVPR